VGKNRINRDSCVSIMSHDGQPSGEPIHLGTPTHDENCALPFNSDILQGLDGPRSFHQDRFIKLHMKKLEQLRKEKKKNCTRSNCDATKGTGVPYEKHAIGKELCAVLTKADKEKSKAEFESICSDLKWQVANGETAEDRERAMEELYCLENNDSDGLSDSDEGDWST